MKTMTLINLICDAISGLCNTRNLIRDRHVGAATDDAPFNASAVKLNSTEWLALSHQMTAVQKLFRELPEQLAEKRHADIDKFIDDLHLHMFYSDELKSTLDYSKMSAAMHELHCYAHDLFDQANEAINLYT